MEPPINVCFLSDDAYIQHMTVAAVSAADHASRPVEIWLVHPGLSAQSQERLACLKEMVPGLTLHLLQCDLSRFDGYPKMEKWPLLIYAKLLLPEILPVNRVIVLDCDMVVMDDLAKLYDTPFPAGIRLAACSDLITKKKAAQRGYDSPEDYFNAGMLLLDLNALRQEDFSNRVLDVPAAFLRTIQAPEQDLLNRYFHGNYLKLDSRWNLFADLSRHRICSRFPERKEALFAAKKSPGVIHFTTFKPWNCSALPKTPYDKDYRAYLKRTPFADYRFPSITCGDVMEFVLPQWFRKMLSKIKRG